MVPPSNVTTYTYTFFYYDTECNQLALAKLNAVPAISNSYGPTTLHTYVKGTGEFIGDGTRQAFRVLSSYANWQALQIVHDTFVDFVSTKVWDLEGLRASVAFQPVTKNFIQQGINNGGKPQGIEISKAPCFCKSLT
jgi:hypothetical protein